jgi:hypothetical protein
LDLLLRLHQPLDPWRGMACCDENGEFVSFPICC